MQKKDTKDSVCTDLPIPLTRLVRTVLRGFYNNEHIIVMDYLIRYPCIKEDDLVELLKLEKKQLRSLIAQLKIDHFVKTRLRMETGADGKATRQNYYYINYKVFVNVVKYKLDHMRRKLETEERDNTSRAAFKCTECSNSYTDLDVNKLFNFQTGEFTCPYCAGPVEEDADAQPIQDNRLTLAKFNETFEPLYILLREVEDFKLAPILLEPEPMEILIINGEGPRRIVRKTPGMENWSGDATKNTNYQMATDIAVNLGADTSQKTQETKEQPVWMTQSTVVKPIEPDTTMELENSVEPTTATVSHQKPDVIMSALLAHEKTKQTTKAPYIPGNTSGEDSDTSESADEQLENVEEMESEEEEDVTLINVGDQKIPVNEITDVHTSKMTPQEKETYIRLTRELHSNYFEFL